MKGKEVGAWRWSLELFGAVIISVWLSHGHRGWLWYLDSEEHRHYDLLKLGLVRSDYSWSAQVIVLIVQVAIHWRRRR